MSTHVRTRQATNEWTWYSDYAYLWAKWTVTCEEGRQCQVGMGVFVAGEPRGEKIRFGPHKEFITVGIGSVHVRMVDGKGPCTVRLDEGAVGLIPIPIPSGAVANAPLEHRSTVLTSEADVSAIERFNLACEQLRHDVPTLFT
jgi:hypothetical protein